MQAEKFANVLVLGGTNFMGKALLSQFKSKYSHINIYTINRGKIYWNNEAVKQNPYVERYYGDRKQHSDLAKTINYINEKIGIDSSNPWKAVIDFTSFRWRDLQSSIKNLKGKTELYIFISSDSMYNNTPNISKFIDEGNFDLEKEYLALQGKKKSDKYGYDKLKCQVYLQRTKYVPYICLRLPDVIGPYDNTERFWCTLFWAQKTSEYRMEINEQDQKRPISFVFSEDVAKLMARLAANSEGVKKFQSYNLAFDECLTVKQFLQKIGQLNQIQHLNFKQIKDSESSGFYPSTNYFSLSCEKAKHDLGWKPTSLTKALKETCDFFILKGLNYENEKKQMMKEFKRKVVSQD